VKPVQESERIARIESHVEHVQADVSDMSTEARKLIEKVDTEVRKLHEKIDTAFRATGRALRKAQREQSDGQSVVVADRGDVARRHGARVQVDLRRLEDSA
jgi:hypothetical protein